MRKTQRLLTIIMALSLAVCCAAPAALGAESGDIIDEALEKAAGMDFESLTESFALVIDTEGYTAEELLEIGYSYENDDDDDGTIQSYSKAMAYYKAALEAGSTEAQDAIDALTAYQEAVIAEGSQGAVFTFYRTGVTASQQGNYAKTYEIYYDDTFFFGDTRGLSGIAELLRDGSGVEQDIEKAVLIFAYSAVVQLNGKGYTNLAILYEAEDGTYPGISHSIDKAIMYYRLSYEGEGLTSVDFKGPRYAANYYDSGYTMDDGTVVEPNYVLTKEWYEYAAAGNGNTFDGTACYMLGTYYEEGREGIEQDYAKAAYYYELALSDSSVHGTMVGIPEATLALAGYYENGIGVEQDLEKAAYYYELAVEYAQENLDLVNAVGNTPELEALQEEAKEGLERVNLLLSSETVTVSESTNSENIYTVVKGDSLWKISLNYYGNGNLCGLIYEANKDTISDPRIIQIGQELIIP